MKPYILYARCATTSTRRYSSTIKYQVKRLEYFAKENNLVIGEVISEIASGTDEKREGIQKLFKLLESGMYQGVLCIGLDRITMSFNLTTKLWILILDKNLEILTPYQTYKTDAESLSALILHTGLSEFYRLQHSERVKRSLIYRKSHKH